MAEPTMADKKPKSVELEPGTYAWCQCGNSKNQPFCDGSHKGTGFAPVRFELSEKQTVTFCMCKRTGSAPKCDGTHSKI